MKITIKEPIWSTKSVGIAKKLITEDLEVEIAYVDTNGNQTFPGIYKMKKSKALSYPVRPAKGKVPKLVIIPIYAFDMEAKKELTQDEKDFLDYKRTVGI